jgi:nicotinamide phosphoribosyltransferase
VSEQQENIVEKVANGLVPFNLADFYKTGHPAMYPQGTETLVANFTPRSAKYAPVLPELFDNKIVWFGLRGFIQEWLIDVFNREFFQKPKEEAIKKYRRRMDTSLGPGAVSMKKLELLHDLGYLPLEIRALPEGARVNIKVPPVLFINTAGPELSWVATYFETLMSCESWKISTVGTIAFEFHKLLTYFAVSTGAPLDFVRWQGHDFSFRGMSGVHDAMRTCSAHLLSFMGTDTIPSIDYLEDYYDADSDKELVGGSIPASEHSVMALRILLKLKELAKLPENAGLTHKQLRKAAELEVVRDYAIKEYDTGLVSMVSDTFDFWNVITHIAKVLKPEIMQRKPDVFGNAKVVFRPDSGDPVYILTGYKNSEIVANGDGTFTVNATGRVIQDHERRGAVECLWDIFGGTETSLGYKLLDSHVGLIYGDSITLPRAMRILRRLQDKGFASTNVVFGIGSYTYNMLSRDVFGWAMKAVYAVVDGEPVEIYKDPATDDGMKKSAKGLLRVDKVGNNYFLTENCTPEEFEGGELKPVFRNGEMLVKPTFKEAKERLHLSWTCPEPNSIVWQDAA